MHYVVADQLDLSDFPTGTLRRGSHRRFVVLNLGNPDFQGRVQADRVAYAGV